MSDNANVQVEQDLQSFIIDTLDNQQYGIRNDGNITPDIQAGVTEHYARDMKNLLGIYTGLTKSQDFGGDDTEFNEGVTELVEEISTLYQDTIEKLSRVQFEQVGPNADLERDHPLISPYVSEIYDLLPEAVKLEYQGISTPTEAADSILEFLGGDITNEDIVQTLENDNSGGFGILVDEAISACTLRTDFSSEDIANAMQETHPALAGVIEAGRPDLGPKVNHDTSSVCALGLPKF